MWSFAICTEFRLKQSTGLFLHGGTILGLPRKIGNANTRPHRKMWYFHICTELRLKQSTGLFLNGGTILCLPGKIGYAGLLKKAPNTGASAGRHWLQKKYKERLQPVEVAAVL